MTHTETPGIPSAGRRAKGPVACIECFQHIPCNPCEAACPHGAIRIGDEITDLPRLDEDRCVGCGLCVAMCPGLAIFLVDESRGDADRVSFPYEYLPLPVPEEDVTCVDRDGRPAARGKVVRTLAAPSFDRTAVVTVDVPKGTAMTVRSVDRKSVGKGGAGND